MDPWLLIWKEKHCKSTKMSGKRRGWGAGDARSVGLGSVCYVPDVPRRQ